MRLPLPLVALLASPVLFATDLAILSRDEVLELGAVTATSPADPAQRAFVQELARIGASHTPLEGSLDLVSPPAWGKTVSAMTRGELEFERATAGGFVCRLHLRNLRPRHRYILTLNGNPKLAGNAALPTPVPTVPDERYYDFITVETDAGGNYAATFGIVLPPGPYGLRFYVKDAADFKIVLFHDYFPFTVK